jgi:hypothetical protein
MKSIISAVVAAVLLPTVALAETEQLTKSEVAALQGGRLVTHTRALEGEVWPEVTVMGALPGTPASAFAAYTDFASHTKFIPGLVRSDIYVGQKGEKWVQTEMKLPWPLENAFCTTRVTLKQQGDSHEMAYTFVEGNHMKGMYGSVRFVPFDGGTLFILVTHTTPKSPLASLWTSRVPKEVEAAARATVKHLSRLPTASAVAVSVARGPAEATVE